MEQELKDCVPSENPADHKNRNEHRVPALADVPGQEHAKRALEVAATGGHNLLMMGPVEVWDYCQVEEAARSLLQSAMNRLSLSARGFHRVLKVARTIADLADSKSIRTPHLAEALQYRPLSVS